MTSDDPRADGFIELARQILGPHQDNRPGRAREMSHGRQILDAAIGYRLATQTGESERAAIELERLRGLVR